ncbi:unnamed protein product [marine sediment metagenome]|uniref:Uncharacterized protein n=1 Tax=marine sediment metagenome TaxID=412755 RepID=X1K3W9_9ZZZZ
MKATLSEITPIVAMVIIAVILITCIANDINHGIIYSGIAVISGLGGYTLGRVRTEKVYQKIQKPPNNSKGNPS